MQQKVANMEPDHVTNMDQTPIPFTFHSSCAWLEKRWKQFTCKPWPWIQREQCMLLLGQSMMSYCLCFSFLKGKNGQIARMELAMLPPMCLFAVQKSLRMDGLWRTDGLSSVFLHGKACSFPMLYPFSYWTYSMSTWWGLQLKKFIHWK